ncbi:hypothetical protein BH23ACT8_BH23ACT8_20040 [soil metagenome]
MNDHRSLWKIGDVAEDLGVAESTVHRLRQDQSFPPPVILSARAVRWQPDQIIAWTRTRQAGPFRWANMGRRGLGRPAAPIKV